MSLRTGLLGVQHGDRLPKRRRHRAGARLHLVERSDLHRMRMGTRPAAPPVGDGRFGPIPALASGPSPQRHRLGGRLGYFLRQADAKGLAHLHDVGLLPLFQACQEVRDIAIPAVRCHRPMGDLRRTRLVHQGQGQRRLGGEGQLPGHARLGPPGRIRSPGRRQVEPRAERPVRPRIRVVRRHHHLTVGDLAQFAAILSPHPDGVTALLVQPRVIHADHPCLALAPPARDHQLNPLCLQCCRIPRAINQKSLQLLQRRLRQHLGHPVHVLPRQLRHQPQQVLHTVVHTPLARKHRPELPYKAFQGTTLYLPNHQLHHTTPHIEGT